MNTLRKTSVAFTCALLAFAAGLPAKTIGSGNVITAIREVSKFHGIELLATGSVVITQGESEGLVIEGEDNIIPLIETRVTDKGTLQIGVKASDEIHFTKPMKFKVSVKTLDAVVVAGSGGISANDLKADRFSIRVLGSGDVNLSHLETGELEVAVEGSGDVKLAGTAAKQTVAVRGSGDYDAASLKTGTATVTVAGSGDCDVSVGETLLATVSGSGDVTYHGQPAVTKHVTGTGSVQSIGR